MAAPKNKKKPRTRQGRLPDEKKFYWTQGEGLAKIKGWLDEHLYDKDIAANIGISQKTLVDWKKNIPTIRTMFMSARQAAVHEVANALYKAALGFHEKEQVIDNKGKKQIVNKYYAPNVGACIFLMKNWAPHQYKDKWDVDMQVKQENPFAGLSTDDLRKLAEGDDIES